MANIKASNFTTQTSIATTDIIPFVTPGSPNTNNKITVANFLGTAPNTSIPIAAIKNADSTAFNRTGTWTPIDSSGAGLSLTVTGTCFYERNGNDVTCIGTITFPTTASASPILIGGLPFTSKSNGSAEVGTVITGYNPAASGITGGLVNANATTFKLFKAFSTVLTNVDMTGRVFVFTIKYLAA